MYNIRIKQLPKTGDQRGYSLVDRNDLYIKTNPINQDTNVKNTISAVPREEANIEAEGGETVVGDINGDGMLEHSNIVGKKHTKGGVPLNINPGSFIFSDTDKLKIKDLEVQALFGMAPNKKGYTPAAIAKKYPVNNFMNILKNDNSDELSKRTAEMMLKNNLEKLGQLALVQESIKGFPDGVPAIAESVMAGMQQQGPQEEMMEGPQGNNPQEESQEQAMARYGGSMPSYQNAGTVKKKAVKEKQYIPTNTYKVGEDKSTGYWDRVTNGNVFQRVTDDSIQNDPRMDIAAQKLNPFSDKVEGLGDYFGNLLSIPQKEINNLLTGYYESPMDTKARYSEVSDNQHFWGDVATDPMMYPELPYAAAKGTAKVVGKGIQKAVPYAKKAAQLTAKYGKQAAEFLSQYIGKIPFEQLLSKGYLVVNRAAQAGMHAMDSPEDKGYERLKSAKINGEDGQIGLIGGKWFDTHTGKQITEFSKFVPKTTSQNKIINPTPNDYIQEATETLPYAPIYNTPPAPVVVKTNDVVKRNKTLPQKSTIKRSAPKVAPEPVRSSLFMEMYGGATPSFEYGGDLPMHQGMNNNSTVTAPVNGEPNILVQRGAKSNAIPDPNVELKVKEGITPKGEPHAGQKFQLFFKGNEQIIKYEDGTIEKAPRPKNNQASFSQYGNPTISRIEAEHPNEFIHTNTNFGSFGAQPNLNKTGIYLSSNNAAARNNSDLSPEEWQDFQQRHGSWIDKKYPGGYQKFKTDLQTSKEAGNKASGWFQDTYNQAYKNKYQTDYFAPLGSNKEDNPYYRDSKFGQFTYSAPGIVENDVQTEKPAVNSHDKENPFQEVSYKPGVKNTPWWIQDDLNLADAMTDSVRKYGPAMTSVDASIPGYVVEDPTRQLASIQESANAYGDTMQNSTAGNVAGASMLNAMGQPLNAAANALAGVENRNVQTVNQAENTGAQISNANQVANANAIRQYMVDSATTNQQYDNALREKKWREIQAFNNGTTNMMRHKQMEDVLFPQYSVNSYNGDVTFNKGRQAFDEYGNAVYDPYVNPYSQGQSSDGQFLSGAQLAAMKKDYIDNGKYSDTDANELILRQMGKKSSAATKNKKGVQGYDNTPQAFNQPANNQQVKNGGKIYQFGGKVYYGALQELNF